jgi:hypothetical protein
MFKLHRKAPPLTAPAARTADRQATVSPNEMRNVT